MALLNCFGAQIKINVNLFRRPNYLDFVLSNVVFYSHQPQVSLGWIHHSKTSIGECNPHLKMVKDMLKITAFYSAAMIIDILVSNGFIYKT